MTTHHTQDLTCRILRLVVYTCAMATMVGCSFIPMWSIRNDADEAVVIATKSRRLHIEPGRARRFEWVPDEGPLRIHSPKVTWEYQPGVFPHRDLVGMWFLRPVWHLRLTAQAHLEILDGNTKEPLSPQPAGFPWRPVPVAPNSR